jgi:hypothetical protein
MNGFSKVKEREFAEMYTWDQQRVDRMGHLSSSEEILYSMDW